MITMAVDDDDVLCGVNGEQETASMPSNETRTDLLQRERQGALRNSPINDRSHKETEKKHDMKKEKTPYETWAL